MPRIAASKPIVSPNADHEPTTTTVWIHTDTSKQAGNPNQLFVFASRDPANEWLTEFDLEGVAFGRSRRGLRCAVRK
jgi:hypothetical protein